MSNRLTKTARQNIRDILLERAFKEEEQALSREVNATHDELVKELFGDDLKVLMKYPQSLRMSTTVDWHLMGTCHYDDLDHPYPDYDHKEIDDEWKDKFKVLTDKAQKLHSKKKETQAELDAALAGFTTYKKLYEQWPELKQVPQLVQTEEPPDLPMTVSLDALNAKLKL